jgi:hypothetical protein
VLVLSGVGPFVGTPDERVGVPRPCLCRSH